MHFCFLQSCIKSQNERNVSAMFQPERSYMHILFKFINYNFIMASFNIELSSKPVKGKKEHLLMLRITVERKHSRVALLYSVKPNQFNKSASDFNCVRANHPEHKKINSYLHEKIALVKEIVQDFEKDKKPISSNLIRSELSKNNTIDFIAYINQHVASLLEENKIRTSKNYGTISYNLKRFTKREVLFFHEIDVPFLNKFQASLLEEELSQTSIHGYLSKIRALFNKALREGVIDQKVSPFSNFKLKQGRPSKDRLTELEIVKLEDLDLKPFSLLDNVRNAFLFSFYNAGIRISDILLMTWDNIKEDRLVYTMYKTSKVHSMKLKDKPNAILNKYKASGGSFIFPFFSDRYDYSNPMYLHNQLGAKTALINKYLKQIAIKAEISKNVTTHTARHSFADIARQKTDNIYNLSKTLGHSSLKVTEAYLASFDEKAVDDTLDSVFNQ
jgi:integrase/recombinase XerD